jgi:hypothetical protein
MEVIMNKRIGLTLILAGALGIIISLIKIAGINTNVIRYIMAGLFLAVMINGIYLIITLLKFYSIRKNSHTKNDSDKTNN